MAVSFEDAIEERVFELVMYITNLIGSQLPNDVIQKIAVKIDECKEQIKDLVKDSSMVLDELKARVNDYEKVIGDLSNENAQLRAKLSELDRENLALKQENQKLKDETEALEAEKRKLEKEADDLVNQLSKMQMENDELRERLFDLEEENRKLQSELEELKKENEWLKKRSLAAEASWESFEKALIKAANIFKREIHDEIATIRDNIRNLIRELRMYINPRGRARLERVNALVNMMYNKIIYKDIPSILIRKMKEILQEQKSTTS